MAKIRLTFLLICVTIGTIYVILNQNQFVKTLSLRETMDGEYVPNSELEANEISPANTRDIVIGMVFCSKTENSSSRHVPLALMKSTIISARLYGISRLTFHIFLEYSTDSLYFDSNLKELGFPFPDVEIQLVYHTFLDLIPKKYWDHMVYHDRYRCGYVRIFFPDALPDVDSILYLDTDTIITGNVGDVWDYLGKMGPSQMIGMVMANGERQNNFPEAFQGSFGDIPHPTTKGLISGFMLMNLTRMREYRTLEKMLRLYDDYKKIVPFSDQKLINVFLYYAEGLLQLLPCQYQFRHTHCIYGLYCDEALTDKEGIQIVHGAAGEFNRGKNFLPLFELYKNITSLAENSFDFKRDIVIPARNAYKVGSSYTIKVAPKHNISQSMCFGIMDQLLYKRFQ